LCGNGQDDTVLFTLIVVHHSIAGGLMLLGFFIGDATLFRHGYLCETGFEVADLIAMLLPLYPYRKYDGMKGDMKAAMVFHHTPGIALAFPIIQTKLYENENLQAIAVALLIGAALSLIFAQYVYSLDLQTQLKHATATLFCNVSFFVYCRWYVFPKHSFLLIEDVKNTPLGDTFLMKMLVAAGVVFSVFNVAITADLIPLTIRYVKRCVDGVTSLEIKPVPSSRDSMVIKSFKRGSYMGRRSSIVDLVLSPDDPNEAIPPFRRSLMANILMQMSSTLDDAMLSQERNYDSGILTETEVDGDSDLSDEDQAALDFTLTAMMVEKPKSD